MSRFTMKKDAAGYCFDVAQLKRNLTLFRSVIAGLEETEAFKLDIEDRLCTPIRRELEWIKARKPRLDD